MRSRLVAVVAACLSLSPPAAAQEFADNARPQQRVEVSSGRSLNLNCVGDGDHTILFDAGGSDWSDVWAPVQQAMASQARACAYDRAGLGFSDPATGPRSPFAIVEDLHSLIAAGELRRPLILVGHSLGGFNVKLYAALYPEDVAGLLLIDPAEDRWWDRTRDWAVQTYGPALASRSELLDRQFMQGLEQRYAECARSAQTDELEAGSPVYGRCTDPVRPALGQAIAAARRDVQSKAAYQTAQWSEVANSVYADHESDDVYASLFFPGAFASRPLIVLTHQEDFSADAFERLGQEQVLRLHRETSQLSTEGDHRTAPNSGHYIQLDNPGSVADALTDLLAAIRP